MPLLGHYSFLEWHREVLIDDLLPYMDYSFLEWHKVSIYSNYVHIW